jgi:3-oxoisoapionate decarboxylase
MSVHLKDMALQPHDQGFRLSEIQCGQGFLDLPRIVRTIEASSPHVHFNLEMATRDPLVVPCLTDGYWSTFETRDDRRLERSLAMVRNHPCRYPPPDLNGKSVPLQIEEEELNNRESLRWLHERFA